MGKHHGKVWDHYNKSMVQNVPHAKCKYCKAATYRNHASRMEKHLLKCKFCPAQVKQQFCKVPQQSSIINKQQHQHAGLYNIDVVHNVDSSSCESDENEKINSTTIERPTKIRHVSSISDVSCISSASHISSSSRTTDIANTTPAPINNFFDHMDRKENDILNEYFAKAIYASATPFAMVSNPFWKEFFTKLRPSYRLPSEYQLKGPLLKVWEDRVDITNKKLLDSCVAPVLMSDGWSCCTGDSHIQFLIATPDPIFIKSVHPKTNRHTADYIFQSCNDIFKAMVSPPVAFVSDHASNMIKAWSLLQEEYPNVLCYGCGAHAIELLATDILKVESLSLTKIKNTNISHFFRNHQVAKAVLQECQASSGRAVVCLTAVPTRWSSVHDMQARNIRLQNQLRIAVSDKRLDSEVKKNTSVKDNLFDTDVFWKLTECSVALLKPIKNAIKEVEGNSVRISAIPRIWQYISHEVAAVLDDSDCPLSMDEIELVKEAVAHRKDFSLRKTHMAAHLLDPRFCGSDLSLSEEQQNEGLNVICTLATNAGISKQDALQDYLLFKSHTGSVYGNDLIWDAVNLDLDPLQWWQAFCSQRPLAIVAQLLMSLPSSIASVERANKEYSMQKTKKRNRLSDEHSASLTKIACNLKVKYHSNVQKSVKKSHVALQAIPSMPNDDISKPKTPSTSAEESDGEAEPEDEDVGEEQSDVEADLDMGDVEVVEGSWVATRYMIEDVASRKCAHRLYYGKVTESSNGSESVKVCFLKQVLVNYYVWPEQEECLSVLKEDVVIVKAPEELNKSSRRRGGYSFCAKERDVILKKLFLV